MNRRGIVYYNNIECGEIIENEEGYIFRYFDSWIANPTSMPISLTLPLNHKEYFSNILFPFFDGLIPEGWLLEIAVKKWKLDRRDRMGLLLTVCEDTIGSVSVKGVD